MALFWLRVRVVESKQSPPEDPTLTQVHEVPLRKELRGKGLYQHYCAVCHGLTGEGDGFNAYTLDPKPRDFTDVSLMSRRSDGDLYRVITQGGPAVEKSSLMPPWGKVLKEKEVQEIIRYLRTFAMTGTQKGGEK